MPRCLCCDGDVTRIYTCKECEIIFCEDCGNPKLSLCDYCLNAEEEEEEEEYF